MTDIDTLVARWEPQHRPLIAQIARAWAQGDECPHCGAAGPQMLDHLDWCSVYSIPLADLGEWGREINRPVRIELDIDLDASRGMGQLLRLSEQLRDVAAVARLRARVAPTRENWNAVDDLVSAADHLHSACGWLRRAATTTHEAPRNEDQQP